MTVFGFAYIIVHDGLVHGRLPVQGLAKFRYLRQVRNAHRVHHLTGEAPYGLFYGPWVVKRMARDKQAARAEEMVQEHCQAQVGEQRHQP